MKRYEKVKNQEQKSRTKIKIKSKNQEQKSKSRAKIKNKNQNQEHTFSGGIRLLASMIKCTNKDTRLRLVQG